MFHRDFYLKGLEKQRSLVKPLGSLGKLEELSARLCGIFETPTPMISGKALIVMCADNHVTEEDIASAPQSVTRLQSENIADYKSGAGTIARAVGAKIYAYDIGINCAHPIPGLIDKKIKPGANNIAKGPAMSREEAEQAVAVGKAAAHKAYEDGANLIAVGEMGIGNTTPATAILCALSQQSPYDLVGIGANFPPEKLTHKAKVIAKALAIHSPDPSDMFGLLSKVGCLEIAGMAGVILGAFETRAAVILDGYQATVAALVATRILPAAIDILIPSHFSAEKSAALASTMLGITPYLHLDMRLGEGSGALLAMGLCEAAVAVLNHMKTFEELGVEVI